MCIASAEAIGLHTLAEHRAKLPVSGWRTMCKETTEHTRENKKGWRSFGLATWVTQSRMWSKCIVWHSQIISKETLCWQGEGERGKLHPTLTLQMLRFFWLAGFQSCTRCSKPSTPGNFKISLALVCFHGSWMETYWPNRIKSSVWSLLVGKAINFYTFPGSTGTIFFLYFQ